MDRNAEILFKEISRMNIQNLPEVKNQRWRNL